MKHKVGDKVRVKSKEWYEDHRCGNFQCGAISFIYDMSNFCGQSMTIADMSRNFYECKEDARKFLWTDEMFEDSEEEKLTKRNLEDNLWICDVAKERACEYFRVSPERMEEMKNEWKERLQSGDYV